MTDRTATITLASDLPEDFRQWGTCIDFIDFEPNSYAYVYEVVSPSQVKVVITPKPKPNLLARLWEIFLQRFKND